MPAPTGLIPFTRYTITIMPSMLTTPPERLMAMVTGWLPNISAVSPTLPSISRMEEGMPSQYRLINSTPLASPSLIPGTGPAMASSLSI